jgi:REP element-mobilizing transposase RayT
MDFPIRHPDFTTVTCLDWQPLLRDNRHKDLIIDSMRYLARERKAIFYAFVIMETHFHVICQMFGKEELHKVQHSFLKFTSQTLLRFLSAHRSPFLEELLVNKKDRKYQVWMRRSLSISLWSERVFTQKLDYIHNNPVKAGLCKNAEDYPYSSARYYKCNERNWDFLEHYLG